MKKMLISIFITMLLDVNLSYAAGDSGTGSISYMYQRSFDGLLGVHKVGGDWSNPDECDNSSRIVLKRDNPSRSEFYSSILAAKMAKTEIAAFLDGCVDWNGVTYPVITGLYTY